MNNELDFMREQIKQRPINGKKLFRRTLLTVTLAIVFGLVACLIFVLLVPAFTRLLNPEPATEITEVTFPEEPVTEEIPPEELFVNEREIAELSEQEILTVLDSYAFDASDLQTMYSSMRAVAQEASASLVTVTGVTSALNWGGDSFEASGTVSGLIVADNGAETLILADTSFLTEAESIRVTFADSSTVSGELKGSDRVTAFGIIAVDNDNITDATREKISVSTLGSSLAPSIAGSPVIAVGSPIGIPSSVVYGMITSNTRSVDLTDSNYTLMTTNITGAENASGVLINTDGAVIGVLSPSLTSASAPTGQLSAIGISSVKKLVEKLVNDSPVAYLGIHGTDVPADVREETGMPEGAYVLRCEMDSPAMEAGIRSGDIITRFDGNEVQGLQTLITLMQDAEPGESISVTIERESPDGYTEMRMSVTPGSAVQPEE